MATYDLSLASADYAPWTGPPNRSIIICTHPRSGSTLLGEALTFAGGLGCPLEYLHRGFRPTLAERWQSPKIVDYVAAMHRSRTDPNGTLSIKLFWQDVAEVLPELRNDFDAAFFDRPSEKTPLRDYRAVARALDDILPNPIYVYLHRKDRLRQAVSSLVAAQTGIWRQIDGTVPKTPDGQPQYDYDRIYALLAFGEFSHGHWRRYFDANGIAPHVIAYEDLLANYATAVSDLLTALGASRTDPPRRMKRQSDAQSDAMMLRFLEENAARNLDAI